ncbi:MAG: Multidrug resistance protein MdtA [Chlamydiales bacterium]|nr:Multidrug resistance protein MdtA [Chlamydiales bacterium]
MRGILFIIVCLLACAGCQKPMPPTPIRPVRAMQLQEEQWVRLHSFPGRTRAVERVNLSFRVEGQLIERPVYVGDEVLTKELLARLDPKDFEVKLQNAIGRLERAEADLRFAERDYTRAQNIWKKDPGAISESLLDQKNEDANRLKGEVKSLEAEVEQAEDQLSYTYLRSPFNGVVVATYVQNYEYVNAKQSIVRLLNTSQVEMVIDLPESMIAGIGNIDKIVVEFDAIPGEEFPATIKEVGTEASATTRTYPLTLVIDQPSNASIYSGMAGSAYLYSRSAEGFNEEGFLVPPSSLMTDDELKNTYVWIINEESMSVEKRQVEKGTLTSRGIIIKGDLEEGEWIVTSGVNYLQDEQLVRVYPVTLNTEGEQVPFIPAEEA